MLEEILVKEALNSLSIDYKTLMQRIYRGVRAIKRKGRVYIPKQYFVQLQKEELLKENGSFITVTEATREYGKGRTFFERQVNSGKLRKWIFLRNKRGLLNKKEIEELLFNNNLIKNNRNSFYSVPEIAEKYEISECGVRRRLNKIPHMKNTRRCTFVLKSVVEENSNLFLDVRKYNVSKPSKRKLDGSKLLTDVSEELKIPYSTLKQWLSQGKIDGFKDYNYRLRISNLGYRKLCGR